MRKSHTAIVLLAALATSITLTACNTIKGAGEDVKATGEAVSGAATDVQNDKK